MNQEIYLLIVYLSFFLVSVCISVLINKMLIKYANDKFENKQATKAENRWAGWKPNLGGVSFFFLFLFALATYFVLPLNSLVYYDNKVLGLFASVAFGFAIGFADDKYNLPFLKLLGQVFCATIMIAVGAIIPITSNFGLNAIFTTFWVVALMNAINMLDNMDGITAIVALSILMAMLIILTGLYKATGLYFVLTVGICGALVGFLFYNWNPSKMYMGDNGSQFLGAFLAFLSIEILWNFRQEGTGLLSMQQFLIPILIFIIPILDSITVTARRILNGKSPFNGGQDHTTHMLAKNGLSDKMVALVMFVISFLSALLAIYLLGDFKSWSFVKSLVVIFYFITVFIFMQIMYERGLKKMNE